MTTTDLKPGDLVQHPTRLLNGLVVHGDGESIRILHLTSLGVVTTTSNLTGWERVESTPPADEKPTSATVTLFCPDCGEAENVTVVMLGKQSNGQRWFDLREFHAHTCPPVQPDEPQEFGARIVVTDDLSGKAERWCRQHDEYWASENGALMTWAYLTQRGAVTLGWETLGWDE